MSCFNNLTKEMPTYFRIIFMAFRNVVLHNTLMHNGGLVRYIHDHW